MFDEPFIGVIPYNARLLGRKLADSWCTMMGDLFCVLFKAVHKFPESPYSRQPPGYGEWFHDYARDDYVITEKDVAMAYQYLVQLHGRSGKAIPVDERRYGSVEFASRFMFKGLSFFCVEEPPARDL